MAHHDGMLGKTGALRSAHHGGDPRWGIRLAFSQACLLAVGVTGCAPPRSSTSGTPTASPTGTIAAPDGWILYRDRDGHFALAAPQEWSVQRTTSTGTRIGNGYSVQVQTLDTHFSPSPPVTNVPVDIDISVETPISDDYHHILCAAWKPDATFAGFPAEVAPGQAHQWRVLLRGASYTINYASPYDPSRGITGSATPPPMADELQRDIDQMLASIRITPDQPIAC